jgi:hypothetical protein
MTTVKTMGHLYLAGALLALVACGGAQSPAKGEASAAPAAQATAAADTQVDAKSTCVASWVRQRECTDQFIPALVDLRVRLDRPAGIATEAQQHGRDALIAQARGEWAQDSTDEAISVVCDRMVAALPSAPVEAALADGAKCLEATTCDAFVSCEIAVMEAFWAANP